MEYYQFLSSGKTLTNFTNAIILYAVASVFEAVAEKYMVEYIFLNVGALSSTNTSGSGLSKLSALSPRPSSSFGQLTFTGLLISGFWCSESRSSSTHQPSWQSSSLFLPTSHCYCSPSAVAQVKSTSTPNQDSPSSPFRYFRSSSSSFKNSRISCSSSWISLTSPAATLSSTTSAPLWSDTSSRRSTKSSSTISVGGRKSSRWPPWRVSSSRSPTSQC